MTPEHFPGGAPCSDWEMGRILVGMRRKWRRRDGSLMPLPRELEPSRV